MLLALSAYHMLGGALTPQHASKPEPPPPPPRFLTHRRNRDREPVVVKQVTDANSVPTHDSQYALRKLHP